MPSNVAVIPPSGDATVDNARVARRCRRAAAVVEMHDEPTPECGKTASQDLGAELPKRVARHPKLMELRASALGEFCGKPLHSDVADGVV